jgi:glycine cleavage system regulatory protein
MKKIGFGIIGLILVAVIYYFTAGSGQIRQEIKTQVNSELATLEQNGFAIQDRDIKKSEEHFIIVFDDPKKIVAFFAAQGAQMDIEDASALKGLRIGVDAKYLNDTYSVLSLDIYPLNLPTSITDLDMNKEDKLAVEQLNNILKRKALLVHIDFNKLLSSFKGHVKDIHETLQGENEVKLTIEGVTFEGDINKGKISRLDQKLKRITFETKDEAHVEFSELKTNYKRMGPNSYDSISGYSVKNILLTGINNNSKVTVSIDDMNGDSKTSIKNDLAQSSIKARASKVKVEANGEKSLLEGITFDFNIKNLDMLALKKLETADINNNAEINRLTQELLSKGVSIEIPTFEIKKIETRGKKTEGFTLTAHADIDKSLDLAALQNNPMAAINAVNTKTRITLSSGIFSLIAKDPRAMILMMLIHPQEVNGKKVYEVEIKNGSLSVNGRRIF